MKKLYGSLNNRFEEGQQFVKEIKVGDGVTEYGYTDRYAYEVVEVIDQNNIVIRKVDTRRIDNNGMSDCQEYEYISNKKNPTERLTRRNNVWFKVIEYSKERFLERANKIQDDFKNEEVAYNYIRCMAGLTENQYKKIDEGKVVKKYVKKNISVGIMQEYFDYSF